MSRTRLRHRPACSRGRDRRGSRAGHGRTVGLGAQSEHAQRRIAIVPAGHAQPQRQAGGCPSMSRRRRKPKRPTRTRRSASWACRPRRSKTCPSSATHSGLTPAGSAPTPKATARASCPTRLRRRRAGDGARHDRAERSRRAKHGLLRLSRRHPLFDDERTAVSQPAGGTADYQSFDTLPGVQVPVLSVTVPDRDPAAGDILTTNGPGPGPVRAADLHTPGPARVV